MKKRYSLVCRGHRGGIYYCYDSLTKKRETLGTKDPHAAERLVDAKNEASHHAGMNLQIAQIYLRHSDSGLSSRTWQMVMDAMTPLKTGPTQKRWELAIRDAAFDLIRNRRLIDTTPEHFLVVLSQGTIST